MMLDSSFVLDVGGTVLVAPKTAVARLFGTLLDFPEESTFFKQLGSRVSLAASFCTLP